MKLLFAILLLAGFSAPALAGQALDRIMQKKVMVEVTDQAYPPFSYVGDKGEMVGFDIDVAAELAKRLGVSMKVETPAFEIISGGNWQGRWDVCVCSMTPTPERRELMDFPANYYATPAVILVHVDNASIHGVTDLAGKRVGVEAGTTYEKYARKELKLGDTPITYPQGDMTAKPYENEDAAFLDLGLGDGKRLDAIVANYVTAKEHVKKAPDKFKIVGKPLFAEPIAIATERGADPAWNAKIKEIMGQMAADGTLKAISEKWIGIDITTKP